MSKQKIAPVLSDDEVYALTQQHPKTLGIVGVCRAIEQAVLARVGEVREWQPIETAPKDGTSIWAIGYIYNRPFQYECAWNGIEWYHGFGDVWDALDPAHWMPLPAAIRALKGTPAAAVADAQPLIPGTPKRIWLIVDHDDRTPEHFDVLEEVSWCAHPQGPDDIKYVLAQPSGNSAQMYGHDEYKRGLMEAFHRANMTNANRQDRTAEETCAQLVRCLGELANAPQSSGNPGPLAAVELDAERYRTVRRGQHWSVIDGIGADLRGEELDAAADAAIAASKEGASHG